MFLPLSISFPLLLYFLLSDIFLQLKVVFCKIICSTKGRTFFFSSIFSYNSFFEAIFPFSTKTLTFSLNWCSYLYLLNLYPPVFAMESNCSQLLFVTIRVKSSSSHPSHGDPPGHINLCSAVPKVIVGSHQNPLNSSQAYPRSYQSPLCPPQGGTLDHDIFSSWCPQGETGHARRFVPSSIW